MKASWKNQIIAESDETIAIEGNYYFPPESVNRDLLKESAYTTECVWKGTAHYYNVVVENEINENAAWYYPTPKDGSVERVGKDFTNHIAFFNGVTIQ